MRANVAGYGLLIVIECRDESRPIDVNGIGEFATNLHDVQANKGIIISTSGFTEGAVTMARARGITTRTYIDTESIDWRQDVAISVLVIRHELQYQVGFASILQRPFDLPHGIPLQHIELLSPTGESLGRIDGIVDKLWAEEALPHDEGTHTQTLVEHAVVHVGDKECHAMVELTTHVKHHAYLGSVPVKMTGVRDEQEKFLSPQKIQTAMMDFPAIIAGTAPGWTELPRAQDLSIKATMTLTTFDAMAPPGEED
jgi:Restriction endonuclease